MKLLNCMAAVKLVSLNLTESHIIFFNISLGVEIITNISNQSSRPNICDNGLGIVFRNFRYIYNYIAVENSRGVTFIGKKTSTQVY